MLPIVSTCAARRSANRNASRELASSSVNWLNSRRQVFCPNRRRKRGSRNGCWMRIVAAGDNNPYRSAADMFYGGYAGYFQDPDGHLWEVAWNPDIAVADD